MLAFAFAAASGGGHGAAAAAVNGGSADAAAGAEVEHFCPICIDNADDADVGSKESGMCFGCGQMYCGDCAPGVGKTATCPLCRVQFAAPAEERFRRLEELVSGTSRDPGRHTPAAQNHIATMYSEGTGVDQDYEAAVKWYTKAATQGFAKAQYSLGLMYSTGSLGVAQNYDEAVRWLKLAAAQEVAGAGNMLIGVQAAEKTRRAIAELASMNK